MDWYRSTLGFIGDPFPVQPPHDFAILRQGPVELMLRHDPNAERKTPRPYEWDVYVRRQGERFRELFAAFSRLDIVTRRLERMPYGLAEFEIADPDGHVICLSQQLENADDLPMPAERA